MGNPVGSATPPSSCTEPLARGTGERAAALRILDANANRASEGLRVLDDVARFSLDDAPLASQFKEIRHLIRAAVGVLGVDPSVLVGCRDAPGDVGHESARLAGVPSTRRRGLAGVVRAGAGRTAEALRSLEEIAKLVGPPESTAAPFETLRYRVYELERAMLSRLISSDPARQLRLCVLISESLCVHHSWLDVAAMSLRAGADGLQLREKDLDGSALLSRARALVELADRHHAEGHQRPTIVINDRPDIAVLAGADGVHVGQQDLCVRDIRRLFGHTLRVGVSTSCLHDAQRAIDDGADSCGVGPMFPSTTKAKDRIAGAAYLSEYLASPSRSLPHLAIGGITAGNVGQLVRVGCRGVAVSAAVCSHADPTVAVTELLAQIPASESVRGGSTDPGR